jgi:hypothetical protein
MLDLAWHVRFRFHVRPHHATGDTTYGTLENITALEREGIHAYMSLSDWEHKTAYYGPRRFSYDAARDVYVCPQGQPLRAYRRELSAEKVEYRAAPATCNACPVKAQCTPSAHGRIVHRHFAEAYLDRVRAYHQGEPYAKAMRKRKVWVEPLFAEGEQWHGMRRFRLRRLWRVNNEALLLAAGQNLKRLLQQRGWGRRPFPDGVAAAVAGLWVLRREHVVAAERGAIERTRETRCATSTVPDTASSLTVPDGFFNRLHCSLDRSAHWNSICHTSCYGVMRRVRYLGVFSNCRSE